MSLFSPDITAIKVYRLFDRQWSGSFRLRYSMLGEFHRRLNHLDRMIILRNCHNPNHNTTTTQPQHCRAKQQQEQEQQFHQQQSQ